MRASFEATVVVYALGVACACVLAASRARSRSPLLVLALVLVELCVSAQAIIDVVRISTGVSSPERATHIGYLFVSVAALPIAAGSVHMDESRWGSAALAVGCVVVAVVSIRLHQTAGTISHA